jgi:hypothetical protein
MEIRLVCYYTTHVGALDRVTQGGLGPQIPPPPPFPFFCLIPITPLLLPIRTKLKITLAILRKMILDKGERGVLHNILWDLPSFLPSFPIGRHINSQLCDPTEEQVARRLSLHHVLQVWS